MSIIFSKIEIDVSQISEIKEACELCKTQGIPAMVVHPSLSSVALVERGSQGGRYKIASPIDNPKGDIEGVAKFRHLSTDTLEADIFEVYVSVQSKTAAQIRKSLTDAHNLIRDHISNAEIRYVIVGLDNSNISNFIQAFVDSPTPKAIRNDMPLKAQVKMADISVHRAYISMIREHTNIPVKIGGNITYSVAETLLSEFKGIQFAVNLSQANAISKEFYKKEL